MPSVLPAYDEEPVTCSEFTLFVTFCFFLVNGSKVHYVPSGIFPHLVGHVKRQRYVILDNIEYRNYLFRDVALCRIEPSCFNKMKYVYNMIVVDKIDHHLH